MQNKIFDVKSIMRICEQFKSKKIVTTNGAFDILHAGHVQFLQQAKALGDVLIVGLNSDKSVKSYKGNKRPLNNQEDRAAVLSALSCVDYVVMFDEKDPCVLLEAIKPNIHVKAGDYTLDAAKETPSTKVWERETVETNGGEVRILPLLNGRSTTDLIRKIVETYKDEKEYKECVGIK
ncbi:MAG: D-glycero-beta-D-manno-heptose 1-phosphate adenylyltransferase [Candidatus Aenigmarchaeota archaeon]|nr:D-glycero-beta-D-manno-heptose 1-phosphate adenylyltransferase [Candidatus Aenigmarchaeota archaeon]